MLNKFIVMLVFAFLTGCTLHQPLRVDLPVDLPERFKGDPTEEANASLVDPWWLIFEDRQLSAMMETLFAENLELSQSVARLQQVEAVYGITRSAQSPTLSANGNLSRTLQPGITDDFIGNSHQLSLAASFELDLWGKLSSRAKAAGLELAASHGEIQALYLGLSARLADLYFLAIEQRAQLSLTVQAIDSFSDTAARVEDRYRLGLVPAIDMYQARQSLAGAQAALYLYKERLAVAEHAIAVLLGQYPDQNPPGGLSRLPTVPTLFEVGVPADLITQRPDLQAALQKVEAADAKVAAAIADRFPTLSLTGSSGTLRQNVSAGLIGGEFWNLLGNLAMPILDGGRRRAEVDRQKAVLAEAVATYQQKVLVAFQDVEDALSRNYLTEQRIERLDATMSATGATLRLSTERYLAGLDDYLPVLTAQRADFDARSRLLSAQRQLLADRISMARALGGRWMQELLDLRLLNEKDKQ